MNVKLLIFYLYLLSSMIIILAKNLMKETNDISALEKNKKNQISLEKENKSSKTTNKENNPQKEIKELSSHDTSKYFRMMNTY